MGIWTHKFAQGTGLGTKSGVDRANAMDIDDIFLSIAGTVIWTKSTGSSYLAMNLPLVFINGGSLSGNTHIIVIGCKEWPTINEEDSLISDMDYGQVNYGGSMAYLQGSTSLHDSWIDIDFNGQAFAGLDNSGRDNWHFKNFRFHNTSRAFGKHIIQLRNGVVGGSFRNCIIEDGYNGLSNIGGYSADVTGMLFQDCYFSDMANYLLFLGGGAGVLFDSCIFNILPGLIGIRGSSEVIAKNSLFLGGAIGTRLDDIAIIHNSVFYGQTVACISGQGSVGDMTIYNNIFSPATIGALAYSGSSGSIKYWDYNLAFSIGNGVLTNPYDYNGVFNPEDIPMIGNVSLLQEDPLFANVASNDFRLKPISPCIGTGLPLAAAGFSNMGLWDRKQYPYNRKMSGVL